MENVQAGVIVVPGIVGAVFLVVVSYLQRQLRDPVYRLWQAVWACYIGGLLLHALSGIHPTTLYVSHVLLIGMAMALLVSSRPISDRYGFRRSELLVAVALLAWAALDVRHQLNADITLSRYGFSVEVGISAVMILTGWRFYREGIRRDSMGYRLLAASMGFWSLLLITQSFDWFLPQLTGLGQLLNPLPQVLLGIAMVMVMFEYERRQVQENALALSVLEVDTSALHSPEELEPALQKLLNRVMRLARTARAVICIRPLYRRILPSVQVGFGEEFIRALEEEGVIEALSETAYRRGGIATLRRINQPDDPLSIRNPVLHESARQFFVQRSITSFTAVSLQARNHFIGCLLFPHDDRQVFPTGQLRLLLALNMQVGLTLDNYILMHEARRRTKEYELLTQIGQVISSRLDPDEVLRGIQRELGRLFDTRTFYVAFQDGENLRFDFETVNGEVQPKRSRKFGGGFSDHVIHTGQPLIVPSGVEKVRDELGITQRSRDIRCYLGVPLRIGDRTTGVMGVVSHDREFAFEQRDLDVLLTAAGQVSVALENALLFADAKLRARDLTFLNHISARAISSQNAEEMLPEIAQEIQKNFAFEHIGIGFLDYVSKDIEIKAEAGTTSNLAGKRVPLGTGILGRVARSGEFALVQDTPEKYLHGLLPESRSVLCIPLAYGETLLGVLNIESTREHAFSSQDILLLRTLADLLSTALHNALIFQKMQQQSITDSLTGIKTRRFFLEALSQEWKRAARSGRPFSVVLVDLDKFKDVNDTMGHLEGDLVLARVGRLLEQKCRQSNIVARYGGDEFVILMPETGVEQAMILSERLRLWMATDPMLNERKVTGSFGVASFPLHGASTEDIIRVADAGMYVSKHAGGNRVSTAKQIAEAETTSMQRRQLRAYIEGFLHREHSGPEHTAELVATLKRMCATLGEPTGGDCTMEAIRFLNHAVESREMFSSTHGSGVAFYARVIGEELGLTPEEMEDLVFAATVHDVGKIAVPERLLSHPEPLTGDEFNMMKMHSVVGAQILEAVPNSHRMCLYVRNHHERFDGLGYPDALKGEEIPLGARIIAVADAFVNMTTDRPFAPAKPPAEAVQELESLSGLQFDGMIVRILTAHLKGERMSAGK